MRHDQRPSRQRFTRRRVALIGGIMMVLLVGVYGGLSYDAWKGYESRLAGERQTYERLRKQATRGSVDQRLKALRALDDKLDRRAGLCHMNPLFAWQASIIPALKEGVSECQSAAKRLDHLAVPVSGLRDYLDTGMKIRKSVGKLSPGSNLTESNWSDLGLERAKTVQKEIAAMKATGDAAALKQRAQKLADNLVVSWEGLIKANEAKDKAGFIAGAAAVAKAYADFGSLADESDTAIRKKVTELTAAADAE